MVWSGLPGYLFKVIWWMTSTSAPSLYLCEALWLSGRKCQMFGPEAVVTWALAKSNPPHPSRLYVLWFTFPLCLPRPRFGKNVCVFLIVRLIKHKYRRLTGTSHGAGWTSSPPWGHLIFLSPDADFCRSWLVHRNFTKGKQRKQM